MSHSVILGPLSRASWVAIDAFRFCCQIHSLLVFVLGFCSSGIPARGVVHFIGFFHWELREAVVSGWFLCLRDVGAASRRVLLVVEGRLSESC